MKPVEAQRHRQLVGLLRSSASPAEKAAALKQTSDVFEISHLGVKKWEAFRDSEVFDSLLAAVSNIDLHQPSAITLLDEALGRLKFLSVNPLSANQILLNQRMSNSIAKYMPPILVITHSALKVVRCTKDPKLWSMQHSFISILGAIIPSQALRDKNLVSSLDRNKVLSILFSTYMAPSVEHRELPALSGTRVLSAYFKDGDFRNEAIHEILQHSAPEAIAQRCCELFERNELSREPMFLGAIHFMLGVADSTKMRRPLIEAKVHLAMVKRYWRWVGERIRHEEELCLFARSVIAATGALLRTLDAEEYAEIKARMVKEMILDDDSDLMLVLGRTLLGRRSFVAAASEVRLVGQCIRDAGLRTQEMETAYMHCFKCLDEVVFAAPYKKEEARAHSAIFQDNEKPDYTPAIQGWKEFGKLLGFDRNEFLQKEAQRRKDDMGGLEGCSWFRCCLYRDTRIAPSRAMMRCADCKSVQYCSTRCQKLDWKEGGHKLECGLN